MSDNLRDTLILLAYLAACGLLLWRMQWVGVLG